jgi:long-chain acyl-CoA synthetase
MLHSLFRTAAVNYPSKAAVIDTSREIRYCDLQREAELFAKALKEKGAKQCDRVALTMPNSVTAAIAIWGTWEAGCVLIPLHAGLKGAALDAALQDAQPHWLVREIAQIEAWPLTSREDSHELASILYTSGSSGEPKGVMLTHANMMAGVEMVNEYLLLRTTDVIYSPLPLSSSYGLYQLVLGLAVGATVLLDRSFAFPTKSLEFAANHKTTVIAAVPTMLGWIASNPQVSRFSLGSLRIITSAAAALPSTHASKLCERLPQAKLYVMYGQTECKRISFLHPDTLHDHADSVGMGLPQQEHRIVDEHLQAVAPGEIGELAVRGPHVMRGYWRKPSETALKLQSLDNQKTPWLMTGDAFRADAEGYLYFVGRKDEVLKIGGNKVSPAEIENTICQLPEVLEAAVIGVPDPVWGEVAAAFVVKAAASALSIDDVRRHCSQRLRGYMVPRVIQFAIELPKTASGKIHKRLLKPVLVS